MKFFLLLFAGAVALAWLTAVLGPVVLIAAFVVAAAVFVAIFISHLVRLLEGEPGDNHEEI